VAPNDHPHSKSTPESAGAKIQYNNYSYKFLKEGYFEEN